MKIIVGVLVALSLLSGPVMAFDLAQYNVVLDKESNGPAPNSGDGIPDGSGFDDAFSSSKRK